MAISDYLLPRWARRSGGRELLLVIALQLLFASPPSSGSDIQSVTNEAAVEVKARLCIALHELERPRPVRPKAQIQAEVEELKKEFFGFHDGKTKSARFLDPAFFSRGQIGPLRPFKVQQIFPGDELHVTIGNHRLILRGTSTEDMAVGQSFSSKTWWRVSGTQTYDTVGGATNTVFVLEPAGQAVPRVVASREYPWYDLKNKVIVTGEFKRIEGLKAVFRVGEEEQSIELSKLAKGDRALVRLLADREDDGR